jgi:hypothetical protein
MGGPLVPASVSNRPAWDYFHIFVSIYPRPHHAGLMCRRLAHRGRRRSRRSDDGVRRGARQCRRVGAPGGAGLLARARAPRDPHPLTRLGSRNLGALTSADRKAGEGSLASSLAPPGAPSPRCGEKEKGRRAAPRPEKHGVGAAERWLPCPMAGQEVYSPI